MATAEANAELHRTLSSLFNGPTFDQPSGANTNILLAYIAKAFGSDLDDLRKSWKKRSGDNAQFLAQLKRETLAPQPDYRSILEQLVDFP
ncbi:hypothetical protein C8R46DRAFT_1234966 [Mycena filopes]|nr:hypothetical protein C8R46DRAFT_1234966 [Mycena filopes]